MVDGIELTSQNPIFFLTWFLVNIPFPDEREFQCFFYWRVRAYFFEDFLWIRWNCSECKSEFSVLLHFKNSKWIIPEWSRHKYSKIVFSPKLRLLQRYQIFTLVSPLLFALNMVLKDQFFVTWNNIPKKQIISMLSMKSCCCNTKFWACLPNVVLSLGPDTGSSTICNTIVHDNIVESDVIIIIGLILITAPNVILCLS